MDSNGFKKIAVSLLLSGLVSAYPCSVNLPPSCIDLQDAAYSAELDIHFHLCALAKHYFPDCVPVKPRAAEEGRADSGNGETPEERLFKDGWEALRRKSVSPSHGSSFWPCRNVNGGAGRRRLSIFWAIFMRRTIRAKPMNGIRSSGAPSTEECRIP